MYELEGLSLSISLERNPIRVLPETLFALAIRKNIRRNYIFVSKVLGKHIPVNPVLSLLSGAALAAQYSKSLGAEHALAQEIEQALKTKRHLKEVFDSLVSHPLLTLPQKTSFIGFAETATALGQTVFSLFGNAFYLHTTREQLPWLKSELEFREEHSHAINHRCYPLEKGCLETSETIVLVDDELTTGKTALNFIRAIHQRYPKKDYVVLSLLDWRTAEYRLNFEQLECELGTKIKTISLMEGEVSFRSSENGLIHTPPPVWEPQSYLRDSYQDRKIFAGLKIISEIICLDLPEVVSVDPGELNSALNTVPYLKLTGRFGVSSQSHQNSIVLAQNIGKKLRNDRQGKTSLCLGSGEFMYFPMLISAYMGEGIVFHSTTRSPLYAIAKADYPVQNGFSFLSPEDSEIVNYVYNLPENYYDEVYFFLERDVPEERLIPLIRLFNDRGIPRVIFVLCVPSKERRFLSDPKNPYAVNP